jgi:toxin secretion/phage lysis holin
LGAKEGECLRVNDIITWLTGGSFAAAAYLFGGIDQMLTAVFIFMIIDYATGMLASFSEKKWSSKTGFKGVAKKAGMMSFIIVATQIDMITGQGDIARNACLLFIVGTEGISILENLTRLGIPIPSFIKKRLEGFVDENDNPLTGKKDQDKNEEEK